MTGKLTDEEIGTLFEAVQSTLRDWVQILRDDVGAGFPEKVTAFRDEMAVHGKFGKPCPDCGTPVQRIRYASNETNYCPKCQTEGRILADLLAVALKEEGLAALDRRVAEQPVGLHERLECLQQAKVPPRQRRTVFDDVADRPRHAFFVQLPRHVIVGAQDVEIPRIQALDQKLAVWSGVQALAGFSVPSRRVRSVNTKPGISRCAEICAPSVLRSSCANASVNAFTPAFETL